MNKTYNATSFIELHQRNQSKMNHRWKYSNLQYYTDPTIAQDRYLISSIQKKVKTRNYICDESNAIQVTNCLDEYYMKQLNCSFPWLQMEFHDLKKCWSNHYIDDLKKLVTNLRTESSIHNSWDPVGSQKFFNIYGEMESIQIPIGIKIFNFYEFW